MMRTTTRIIVILLTVLAGSALRSAGALASVSPGERAASPVLLLGPKGSASLAGHLDLLEEREGRLTIAEVSSPEMAARFRPEGRAVPNFGVTSRVYWVRFTLAQAGGGEERWLLELDYPHMDFLDLYVPRPGGGYEVMAAGDMRPMRVRKIEHRNPVFPLAVNAVNQTFYLRIDGRGRTVIPLTLWTPESFAGMDHGRGLLTGGYFGAMLVMVAYNFFLFLSLRDRNYLYYLLDIFSYAVYEFFATGLLLEYVSGNRPLINQYAFALATPCLFFGLLFARSFLATARHAPFLDRLLKLGMVVALLALPALFVVPANGWRQAMTLVTLAFSFMALSAGVVCLRRGFRPARYYVGARIFRLLGILSLALGIGTNLPGNLLTISSAGLQIGSLLEVLLLSFALADRIAVMRREKEEAQAEAVRKSHLATLGELAAGVAHEINTPVNTIINSAELLHDDDDRSALEHDVAVIKKEGRRIATIVKSLLFFARRPAQEKVPFAVSALLQGTLDMIGARLRKENIALTMKLPPQLPEVMVHPQQIEQVFLNLLTNAMQALAEKHGEEPNRKTFAVVASEIMLKERPFVRIGFLDNGIGIPAFLLDTVKDSFVTTKKTGTGLGLTISQQIVDDHGGSMTIESQEGNYTQVTIDLPAAG